MVLPRDNGDRKLKYSDTVCDDITETQWRQKAEVFRHSLRWYYRETMETESGVFWHSLRWYYRETMETES